MSGMKDGSVGAPHPPTSRSEQGPPAHLSVTVTRAQDACWENFDYLRKSRNITFVVTPGEGQGAGTRKETQPAWFLISVFFK